MLSKFLFQFMIKYVLLNCQKRDSPIAPILNKGEGIVIIKVARDKNFDIFLFHCLADLQKRTLLLYGLFCGTVGMIVGRRDKSLLMRMCRRFLVSPRASFKMADRNKLTTFQYKAKRWKANQPVMGRHVCWITEMVCSFS